MVASSCRGRGWGIPLLGFFSSYPSFVLIKNVKRSNFSCMDMHFTHFYGASSLVVHRCDCLVMVVVTMDGLLQECTVTGIKLIL